MSGFAFFFIEFKSFVSEKIGIIRLSKAWILIAVYAIFLWGK